MNLLFHQFSSNSLHDDLFFGGHSSIQKKEHVWQFGIQCGHQDAHKVLLRLDDLV